MGGDGSSAGADGAAQRRGGTHWTRLSRAGGESVRAHHGCGAWRPIVLSSATHERLGAIPAEVSFLDLGLHRLRDLSTPVHLFQVCHPVLPGEFPALRSLGALANNLPAELSSFVGREAELAQLSDVLHGTRLLMLSGPGGVGKTRLALQLAADQADRYGDGVWLVSLGGLADPALVAPAVASALRIGDQPGRSWLDSVLWYLKARETLLVLDNCEHLINEVASLAVAVLRDCPKVRVLATSREALSVPGETIWHAPPLSLVAAAGASEAQRLFLQRAQEVEPDFRPSDGDTEAIAQVCARLDGIPLAIELAAARVRVLSVQEIADRLHERFRLLTGGSRTALPRQRTMEATVAWSYEQLTEPERHLFDRLSVFAGRFPLDAAEQVCVGGDVRAEDVLDLLTGLADRSLIVHEQVDSSSRYLLLETMRAYGLERLRERGEAAALRDAHLAWLNDFARSVAGSIEGPEQELWLDRVADTLDDVRVGLAWALEDERRALGVGCAASLYRYWYVRNVREGRQWLDRLLLVATEVPPKLLAKALFADGSLAEHLGDYEAAVPVLERALALYREIGNERGVAWTLHALGSAQWATHEPDEVKASFEEALEMFRRLPDPAGIAFALGFLAIWEFEFGDIAHAADLADEMLSLVRFPGAPPWTVAHAIEASAVARWKRDKDVERTRELLREALEVYRQLGSLLCAAHCLGTVAAWALDLNAPEAAARLHGAMAGLREEAGRVQPAPYEQPFDEPVREHLIEQLGRERYELARQRGLTTDLECAIDAAFAVVEATSVDDQARVNR
jgi:predicted ATPase